jgi:hypothetical protein
VQGLTAAQVKVVRLQVWCSSGGRRAEALQSQLERAGDRLRQLLLDLEDIVHITLEGLGPELIPVARVHQLGAEPEAVSCPPDAAFEHGGHPELPSDLLDALTFALEGEGRGARRHPQSFDSAEGRNQLVRHSVGEVVVLAIGAQVAEGKHRDRLVRRPPARLRPAPGRGPHHESRQKADDRDRRYRGASAEHRPPRRWAVERPSQCGRELSGAPEPVGGDACERPKHGALDSLRHVAHGAKPRHRLAQPLGDHRLRRAHVVRSADGDAGPGQLLVRQLAFCSAERLGDAEFGDEGVAVAGEQDVLGLDVAVDDAMLMGVVQRLRRLPRDPERVVKRELPLAPKPVAQTLALDERHGEPQVPGGVTGVVDREDVRMLQPGGEADLALEALGTEHVGQLGVKHLEGDRAVVLEVGGEEHRGHAAAAELAEEGVAAR